MNSLVFFGFSLDRPLPLPRSSLSLLMAADWIADFGGVNFKKLSSETSSNILFNSSAVNSWIGLVATDAVWAIVDAPLLLRCLR